MSVAGVYKIFAMCIMIFCFLLYYLNLDSFSVFILVDKNCYLELCMKATFLMLVV